MAVKVRLFAALREAAGTAQTEAAPGSVAELVAELSERYGEPFAARARVSSVLVDGRLARPADEVADGVEVVLLPPVSGGAADQTVPASALVAAAVAAVAVPAVLAAALVAGRGWFVGAVVIVAVVVTLDLGGLLALAAARPVLLAAGLPALALPVAAGVWPETAWEHVPSWMAGALLLAAVLVLVAGRRRGAVAGLGATLTVSLIVGLGAAGLILLGELPGGFRWLLAVLVLVAAADLGATVAEVGFGAQPVAGAVPATAGTGAVALLAVAPPLDPAIAIALVVAALVGAVGGSEARRAFVQEAGGDPSAGDWRWGSGGLLGAADGVLVTAPVAYLVGRAAGL